MTVTEPRTSGRPGLLTAYRWLAGASAAVVVVMAYLAGHSDRLFGTGDIGLHGYLGELLFAVAVVMVVLSFLTQTRGVVVGHAVAFAALCFAQVGLGFVGRDTLEAAAWHIPNGVLIMGVAVAHVSLLLPGRTPPG
ncbi:MAG TPA: hypothetical protein VD926_14775 [Acidimicrobiales bacterium]|nr:hypothetical protein [Acidimicrobiales bacterium]